MRRIALPVAALLLATYATCATAQTTRLDLAYSAYLTGIPIGQAAMVVDFTETGFVAAGTAKSSGFIRIISKGDGSATVRGSFLANRVSSSTLSARLKISRRDQKIEINVINGFAKEFSIEPPSPEGDVNRVPITDETRKNVVDPLSAALALVPAKGDALSPESCNRTLPIFDGRYRYNLVLSYLRTEAAPSRIDGYKGPALVCAVRYVPVAGHRIDGTVTRQMAENRDMFVWLAPVSGTRVLAPIKASVSSIIGTFVVEATRFQTTAR